ncbi:MAG: DNA alkylation repair protein [Anaerolineaceae bacterium]|nr:DNA alkylation repair protein [Anaerolineaceae bacterium]
MPAIQLNRVREQINQIAWLFTQPDAFQRGLRDLLEFYANPIYRPGQTARSIFLLPTYRTSKLLFQQLELALYPLIQENPKAALTLADTLWQDDYLEPRLIAAYILGQLPIDQTEEVTTRIIQWCAPSQPAPVLDAVLTKGTEKLRLEEPQILYELASTWLSSSDSNDLVLGLKLLHPLVKDPGFENLPEIFNLIKLPLRNLSPRNLTEAQNLLQALAKRSPMETSYFLRQTLSLGASKDMIRLVRKTLPAFPAETQERLRLILKEKSSLPPT